MNDPFNKFDLSFKPKDYFYALSFNEKAGAKIFGELRRVAALNKIKTTFYPPELVGRKFHSYLVQNEGRKHPWLLGGEFLPELYDDEIEICRVVFKSSSLDVISLRVQKVDGKFHFRLVDEHELNDYKLPYEMTKYPLSMRELITNLDCSTQSSEKVIGLVKPWFLEQITKNTSLEDALEFVTVHSIFYPELENYYEKAKDLWYHQIKSESL